MTFHVCLVRPGTYPHSSCLQDTCDLIVAGLSSLGHICTSGENTVNADATNIVIGWHLLGPGSLRGLPWVAYQLEQLSNHEGWWTPERERVLREAAGIWDYAPENIAFLTALGFENVKHVPFGYHSDLSRMEQAPEDQKEWDVCFVGCMNERRAEIIRRLEAEGLKVTVLGLVYGAERDSVYARSRICLNLHYYDAQIMEQMRVSYLLNNQCFVVSEQAPVNPYKDLIVTGQYNELADLCVLWAKSPRTRGDMAVAGWLGFKQRPMTTYLAAALEEKESACAA
jgi:hypothetical protein